MYVEYLVVTILMMFALFLPVPYLDGSVVDWVISALKGFQNHNTVLMSLP